MVSVDDLLSQMHVYEDCVPCQTAKVVDDFLHKIKLVYAEAHRKRDENIPDTPRNYEEDIVEALKHAHKSLGSPDLNGPIKIKVILKPGRELLIQGRSQGTQSFIDGLMHISEFI